MKPKQSTPKSLRLDPVGDRVLVRRLLDPAVEGRIIVPDSARKETDRALVLAVGPGKMAPDGTRLPMEVAVGDTVVLPRFAVCEIKIDGIEHLIVRESEIQGVFSGMAA